MPRLYREAPLNSIWEGSGNINALDVLRILRKHPEALAAWLAEIEPALAQPPVAAAAQQLERDLRDLNDSQAQARSVAERMALLWQASLLLAHAPSFVSDAFIAGRVAGSATYTLGTLPRGIAFRALLDRAAPVQREAAIA
jgi:putative acyl-CoA dehydrogenase